MKVFVAFFALFVAVALSQSTFEAPSALHEAGPTNPQLPAAPGPVAPLNPISLPNGHNIHINLAVDDVKATPAPYTQIRPLHQTLNYKAPVAARPIVASASTWEPLFHDGGSGSFIAASWALIGAVFVVAYY